MLKMKRKVNFDICTFCNHKCNFCSNPDPRTIKDQTSWQDFVKVMKNITKYVEIYELGLSAKGEVLINKDFSRIIESCKKDFEIPYVYFSTNGALLTEERANEVLEAGIDSIKFSINALDAESYQKVHQVDDFDVVILNLKNLLALKKHKYQSLKVMISSVIDLDETSLKKKFRKILGDDFDLVDIILVYPLFYTPIVGELDSSKEISKKCSIPFKEIYINSDCSLQLCCQDYFDEINFGSLLEHDYMDLYMSKAFLDIRTMHETSIFPDNHLCKNCLLYEDGQYYQE